MRFGRQDHCSRKPTLNSARAMTPRSTPKYFQTTVSQTLIELIFYPPSQASQAIHLRLELAIALTLWYSYILQILLQPHLGIYNL